MPTAAINQHGCRVSLNSERLEVFGRNEVTGRDEVLREIPIRDLDRLIIAETVQITSQALAALLRADIPVVVLGWGDQFLGGFLPAQNAHGLARLRQYQRTLDAPFGLQMAGRIVTAKLYNQRLGASRSDVGQTSGLPVRASSGGSVPRRRTPQLAHTTESETPQTGRSETCPTWPRPGARPRTSPPPAPRRTPATLLP